MRRLDVWENHNADASVEAVLIVQINQLSIVNTRVTALPDTEPYLSPKFLYPA